MIRKRRIPPYDVEDTLTQTVIDEYTSPAPQQFRIDSPPDSKPSQMSLPVKLPFSVSKEAQCEYSSSCDDTPRPTTQATVPVDLTTSPTQSKIETLQKDFAKIDRLCITSRFPFGILSTEGNVKRLYEYDPVTNTYKEVKDD